MENQSVEYKSEIPKKQNDLKAEIVAFLNSNDGVIHLGVDDYGKAIPEKSSMFKSWEELVSNWINNAFNTTVQDLVKLDITSQYFIIRIKQGRNIPYYYKDGDGFNSKGIYIRCGSSKRRANDEEVRRMIERQMDHEFESQTAPHTSDLSFTYLTNMLLNVGVDFDIKGLRLQNNNNQYTNGSVILSDQNPHLTKIAVIDGTDMSAGFLAKKELNGSLIKQIDMTLEYISLLNDKKVSFTGAPARIELDAYPSKAIREAVINAYAHRNYSLSADIKVEVYDNRMEIFSAGGLPDGLSIEDIIKGISARRNRNIVHVLDKINYMENYASGIRRIIASYKDFEKKPEFIVTPNQFKVVLYNRHDSQTDVPDKVSKYNLSDGEQLELGFIDKAQKTLVLDVSTDIFNKAKLDLNDEKIIKLLTLNEELSRQYIQDIIQESKTKTYQRLTRLIELGFINKRGQSRSVVYFLDNNERK